MHKNRSFKKLSWGFLFLKLLSWVLVADLGEGPVGPAPPPLTLGKKKKKEPQTEEKPAGQATKTEPFPPPPLSSRLGSATRCFARQATLFLILFETAKKKKKIRKIKKKITVCFPQLSVLSIRPLHWQRINKLQSIINYHRRDLFSF